MTSQSQLFLSFWMALLAFAGPKLWAGTDPHPAPVKVGDRLRVLNDCYCNAGLGAGELRVVVDEICPVGDKGKKLPICNAKKTTPPAGVWDLFEKADHAEMQKLCAATVPRIPSELEAFPSKAFSPHRQELCGYLRVPGYDYVKKAPSQFQLVHSGGTVFRPGTITSFSRRDIIRRSIELPSLGGIRLPSGGGRLPDWCIRAKCTPEMLADGFDWGSLEELIPNGFPGGGTGGTGASGGTGGVKPHPHISISSVVGFKPSDYQKYIELNWDDPILSEENVRLKVLAREEDWFGNQMRATLNAEFDGKIYSKDANGQFRKN